MQWTTKIPKSALRYAPAVSGSNGLRAWNRSSVTVPVQTTLRRQWQVFEKRYRPGLEHPFNEGSARIRSWVHRRALDDYSNQAKTGPDAQALLQAGRCLKALGRYTEVVGTLQEALRIAGSSDSRLLAELSDVYALIGETRIAKVMMREALFQGAGTIELSEICAPLFRRLIDRLEELMDAGKKNFSEWLPVYGVIWGVLDVKRELNPVEFGKLKQSIYALKSEIADGDEGGRLVPRLINRYFWLIDHYQITGSDRATIDEALMNIKLLSSSVYRAYTE